MMSFASSGESKSGGGGNVFLFIPPDCHHKKITQVGCGIKLTQSHNFAVKALRVNSYILPTGHIVDPQQIIVALGLLGTSKTKEQA